MIKTIENLKDFFIELSIISKPLLMIIIILTATTIIIMEIITFIKILKKCKIKEKEDE